MIAGFLLAFLAAPALAHHHQAPATPHASIYRDVLATHRNHPVQVRIIVSVRDAQSTHSSTIHVRVDRGDQTRPRRLRMDLGDLIVCAEGHRLVAVHAANPETYFERQFGAPVTPGLLRTVLPPVPAPHVGWALGDDDAPASWNFWGIGGAVSPSVTVEDSLVRLTIDDASVRDAEFMRTPRGLELTRVNASLTNAPVTRATTSLVCEPLESVDPASWMIDTTARKPVHALTLLRPKPGEVSPGDHLPALGLLTRDLEGWSLSRALDDERARPPRSSARVFAVLLLSAQRDSSQGVRIAGLALDALSRDLGSMRTRADANTPRVVARSVVLVEAGELNAARADEMLKGAPSLPSLGEPLLSTAGAATIERLCPACAAAVVVVDEQLRVVGVVRVERELMDPQRIIEQVRRLVSTRRDVGDQSGGLDVEPGSAAGDIPR